MILVEGLKIRAPHAEKFAPVSILDLQRARFYDGFYRALSLEVLGVSCLSGVPPVINYGKIAEKSLMFTA